MKYSFSVLLIRLTLSEVHVIPSQDVLLLYWEKYYIYTERERERERNFDMLLLLKLCITLNEPL
jgi:hypothetical protein